MEFLLLLLEITERFSFECREFLMLFCLYYFMYWNFPINPLYLKGKERILFSKFNFDCFLKSYNLES